MKMLKTYGKMAIPMGIYQINALPWEFGLTFPWEISTFPCFHRIKFKEYG